MPAGALEIIVIDSYSTDNTVAVAESFGATVIRTTQNLLGARCLGLRLSRGDFVLLLDSDQVLVNGALARSYQLIDGFDMLLLEEHSISPSTLLQRIFSYDRRLTHSNRSGLADPIPGILLPRFYRRELIERAISRIPPPLLDFVIAHDHAIIYYESARLSNRVGMVSNAIHHREPRSMQDLWKKNFRYGESTGWLAKTGYYSALLRRREKLRVMGTDGSAIDWLASTLLLLMKAFPYELGYLKGLLNHPELRRLGDAV